MNKVSFISMIGTEIRISKDLLSKAYIEEAARKHFHQEVICTPCVFGSGSIAVGWRIENKKTSDVIGYLALVNGSLMDYPNDFEYGVTTDVPIGPQWSRFFHYKIRFIEEEIEICKSK